MKRRILLITIVCAALFAGSGARAQSVYNLNLLGQRTENGDVRATALGGSVQIVPDSLGVLQLNPAMLAYSSRVTFGAAVYFTADDNQDQNNSDREGALKFTTFAFAFSPVPRVTLAIGYRANYDPGGGFSTPDTTDAGESYTQSYERTGNVLSFPFSAAVDLGRFLKVGGYYSFENGRLEGRWENQFRPTVSLSSFSQQERTLRAKGWGLGAEVTPFDRLALGLNYTSELDYDTEVVETHTNDQANGRFDEQTLVPEKWTASLRLRVTSGLSLYAGGSYRDFTKFRGLAFPTDRLAEELVVSAGLELRRGLRGKPLWLSGTWEQLPYTLPAGENVIRFAGTVGTGLQLGRGRGKIDLAFQFARTGSVGSNGFETQSIRVYVGISGAEAWSRSRTRR
jgi:hypothetical protein